MQIKRFTFWTALLLSAAMLWGCGSNGSGGSDVAPPPTVDNVQALGTGNCEVCHGTINGEWANSTAHGNSNDLPTTAYFNHEPASDCSVCHDPDGESADFRRPVIGCESCHGGGSAHRGIGPIPYARPDWEQCVQCHDHAEGIPHSSSNGLLASNVGASAHNNADDLHASTTRCQRCHTVEGSYELARYTGDADVMHLMDDVDPINLEEKLHPVTCAACHVPHTDELRADSFIVNDNTLNTGNWDPNGNGVADQFDFCTSCHTYYNQDGILTASGSAASGTAEFYHNTAWYRIIASTHYDDPATGYGLAENIVEGYVIRENSANPCFDCHGHELRTNTRRHLEDPTQGADYGPTIHTDWANSRHGAELLKAKVAADTGNSDVATVDAVMAAGRVDREGHGWSWTHYDWDKTNDTVPGDRTGRGDCQRCHTSTGVSNYLMNPGAYTPAVNDFGHLVGWNSTDGSPQNEMLYCWGCHSNAQTGVLRDPGAITIDYSNDASVEFPDSAASNVCIACHSGRENGDSIKNDPDADGVRSFLNSHYLTAGGILFATGGYEYDGRDYAFAANDRHQNIGYGSAVLTGDVNFDEPAVSDSYTSGPCVTCHFSSSDEYGQERSHTLSPFTTDPVEGEVLNDVCVTCHTARGVGDSANAWYGKDFTEADFVAGVTAPHKGRLLGAQLALQAVLAEKGILADFFSYPYFFADSGFGGGIADNGILEPEEVDRNNGFTNWAGVYGVAEWKNVMGAAFNLNLVAHDPAAAAHNRRYARRLIYDSIDFMDDGIMNDSTSATVTAQNEAFTASALNYIGSRP